jgi:hypothetical protein
MKRSMPDFDDNDNNGTRRIINRLINKISSGEFEVEQFAISQTDDQREAKVKMKINGGSISNLQPDDREECSNQSSSESSEETTMTPDEKKVQAQIASCYM